MKRAAGVLVLLMAAAGLVGPVDARPVAEQEGPDPRLVRAFADGGTLLALWHEIAEAREAGLPVEPLVQKALEGWSKGAPDSLVVGAVQSLRHRLATASDILGAGTTEAELVAAGGALYLGVERDDLARLVAGTTREARPMALVVLGDLVKRGVDIVLASEVLLSLGKVGADAAALEGFRNQVELDIRTGVAPGRAAEVRSRGIVVSLRGGGGAPGGARP